MLRRPGCTCLILPLELVPKAQIIADTRGLVKLVADAKNKRIVGVHFMALTPQT
jgi:mercuric reductase